MEVVVERKGARMKQTTIREAADSQLEQRESRFVRRATAMGTAHFRATKLGAATQRKRNDDSLTGEGDGGVSQCGGVSGRAQDSSPPRNQSLCWQSRHWHHLCVFSRCCVVV